jgi:alkanesulfonate monooxygenase SsuD/methylene tetrahydromethanopterin reductase-like flavin-dependent oxidoreductase (luciferase family)
MQFGFNLPNSGALADPGIMTRIAQAGEAMGYDYLTLTDHIVLPDTAEPGYPYSESGSFYSTDSAHRHELLTAKMLATIDVLSGGRLVVGVGAGWLKAEFDAVVTTPFHERGAVTDEYLSAFRRLWTEDNPRIEGRHVTYDGLVFAPKPVQQPHPPIWVGGESPPSLRRTARLGDAWYPIGSNNKHLLDTLPRYQAGRPPDAVTLTYRVKRYGAAVPPTASDGERRLFSGSDTDLIGDIHALQDLGVTAIDFDFERPSEAEVITAMRDFRERVLAKV